MSVCSERCSLFLDESPDPVSPAGACLVLYSLWPLDFQEAIFYCPFAHPCEFWGWKHCLWVFKVVRKQRASFADKHCITVLGWDMVMAPEGNSHTAPRGLLLCNIISYLIQRFKGEGGWGCPALYIKKNIAMKRKALNGELQVLCNMNKRSKHQCLNSVRSEVPD